MIELLRTNDIVLLSFVRHLLSEANIEHLVLDEYMSAVEGSIGALPRRVLVAEGSFESAKRIIGNHSLTSTGG
jgi:Putative prokaryotic signal transducing protein